MRILILLPVVLIISSCGFNFGGKWEPTSIKSREHHMFDNYHSDGVSFMVVSGKNIYALTQNDGNYLSTDDGTTWVKTTLHGIPDTVKIYDIAANENKMLAGTKGAGVFISEDNGKNWKQINNGLYDTTAYKNYCKQSLEKESKDNYWKKSYTGYSDSAKLYDQTIEEFKNPNLKKYITNTLQISSVAISGKNLYVYLPHGIFSSTDNGENWAKLSAGKELLASLNPVLLSADEKNIFSYCGDQLQRSKDNGKTWVSLSIEIPQDTAFIGENGSVQYEPKSINVIVSMGKTVYAGTSHGVFISNDEGDHWKEMNVGLPDKKSIDAIAVSAKVIFVCPGDYQGVFISTNQGKSWKEFNEGFKHNTDIQYDCGSVNYFAITEKKVFAGIWSFGGCREALWSR